MLIIMPAPSALEIGAINIILQSVLDTQKEGIVLHPGFPGEETFGLGLCCEHRNASGER